MLHDHFGLIVYLKTLFVCATQRGSSKKKRRKGRHAKSVNCRIIDALTRLKITFSFTVSKEQKYTTICDGTNTLYIHINIILMSVLTAADQ